MANRHREPFEVGGITVQPGSRRSINLSISLLSTHTPMEIPIHVIHGKKDGPRLFMCAAIHGDELNGLEIIRRILQAPAVNALHGTLVAVPIVNVFGFLSHSRYLPDRRDLNRSFPGSPKGPLASQLAYLFMKEVVLRCSHGIDLHTAALHRSNLPQVRGNLSDPTIQHLASTFSAPLTLHSDLRDGSLRQAATDQNIPTLLYEAGEALRFDEFAIRLGVRGILRVMQALDMIRKSGSFTQSRNIVSMSSYWVRAPIGGIFRSLHPLGEKVKRGETIGTIADPMGETQKMVKAKEAGILIGRTNLPVINQGDALFHIAKVKNTTAAEKVVEKFQEKINEEINFDNHKKRKSEKLKAMTGH